jgi:hypothetical protein
MEASAVDLSSDRLETILEDGEFVVYRGDDPTDPTSVKGNDWTAGRQPESRRISLCAVISPPERRLAFEADGRGCSAWMTRFRHSCRPLSM